MRNHFLVLALCLFMLSPAPALFAGEDPPSERAELSLENLFEKSKQLVLRWIGWRAGSNADENHCNSCCDDCGDPTGDDPGFGPQLVPGGEPVEQPED